jgi:hypothetical protein
MILFHRSPVIDTKIHGHPLTIPKPFESQARKTFSKNLCAQLERECSPANRRLSFQEKHCGKVFYLI